MITKEELINLLRREYDCQDLVKGIQLVINKHKKAVYILDREELQSVCLVALYERLTIRQKLLECRTLDDIQDRLGTKAILSYIDNACKTYGEQEVRAKGRGRANHAKKRPPK